MKIRLIDGTAIELVYRSNGVPRGEAVPSHPVADAPMTREEFHAIIEREKRLYKESPEEHHFVYPKSPLLNGDSCSDG